MEVGKAAFGETGTVPSNPRIQPGNWPGRIEDAETSTSQVQRITDRGPRIELKHNDESMALSAAFHRRPLSTVNVHIKNIIQPNPDVINDEEPEYYGYLVG